MKITCDNVKIEPAHQNHYIALDVVPMEIEDVSNVSDGERDKILDSISDDDIVSYLFKGNDEDDIATLLIEKGANSTELLKAAFNNCTNAEIANVWRNDAGNRLKPILDALEAEFGKDDILHHLNAIEKY